MARASSEVSAPAGRRNLPASGSNLNSTGWLEPAFFDSEIWIAKIKRHGADHVSTNAIVIPADTNQETIVRREKYWSRMISNAPKNTLADAIRYRIQPNPLRKM